MYDLHFHHAKHRQYFQPADSIGPFHLMSTPPPTDEFF